MRDLHQPTRFGIRASSRLNASILSVALLASVFVSKSKINDQADLASPLTFLNTVTQLSHGFRSVGACSCVTRRSIAQRQGMESEDGILRPREGDSPAAAELEGGNPAAEIGDD
ncbi:MAG: hypothetical protein ABUL62_02635 [Myxococcales bacterium]